jgi:hypothetical protein
MSPHYVLFPGGYASRLMHQQWTQRPTTPLPRNLRCANQGRVTDDFRKLFRSAFPTRDELPDVIATPEGKPTLRFLEVFR